MQLLAAIDYDLFRFGPFEIFKNIPVLKEIDFLSNIAIHSFGLFVAIGMMLTFRLATKRGEEKFGLDGEKIQNFGLLLVGVGWVFAHVFNIIFYEPEQLMEDPWILFKIWGSISSFGGLFGGIFAAFYWRFKNPKEDFLTWVDLGVYGITFSWMFGRIGCASVHDHPGYETDFILAISNWPDGLTRHDLGFYEAIWWAVIVITVLILDRKPLPKGFFIGLVPTMYAPARFLFDFLRVGPEQGGDIRYFGLTPAQYFSIGLFFVGIYFIKKTWGQPPVVWKKFDESENLVAEVDAKNETKNDSSTKDSKEIEEKDEALKKKKRGAGPKKK